MASTYTLGQLPYEAVADICRRLSFQACYPLFCVNKTFLGFKVQIGDLFVGECTQEVTLIKKQVISIPLDPTIDELLKTLTPQTIPSYQEKTKIFLLRGLLTVHQVSDKFFQHPFKRFAGIISVFKCAYQAREQLAKIGCLSIEMHALQKLSRCLINRKRYAEAIEVIRS